MPKRKKRHPLHQVASTLAVSSAILLQSCSLSPCFEVPVVETPPFFREEVGESCSDGVWEEACCLNQAQPCSWWTLFCDCRLNALEDKAQEANFSLQAAASRIDRARGVVQANSSSFYPDLNLGFNALRAKPASASLEAFGSKPTELDPYTLYNVQASASYELDLFRKVKDLEAAYKYDADAQASLYCQLLLTLQADVAQNYFAIRALDSERKLLRETIEVRQEALRIMKKRVDQGEETEEGAVRVEGDLASVEADLIDVDRRRALLEHALAVLLGEPPSVFCLEECPLEGEPPFIPPGLPSCLLQRRPDIFASINTMAAANKRIGVARTAFYPSIFLSASEGFGSITLADLFKWSNRTWALGQLAGTAINWTVFDSGRRKGSLYEAIASYEETVANYRQQVLVAFREVEDNLVAQRMFASQSQKVRLAADASNRTLTLLKTRYQEGDVTYFEVVDAWRTALANERLDVQVKGLRFATTVQLVRALGGGWDLPCDVVEIDTFTYLTRS